LSLGIACRVWTGTARRLLSRCRTPANHGSEDPQHVEMLASRRDGSTAIEGRDGRARGWGRGRSNGSPTRPPRRAPGDAGAVLRTKDANQHHGGAGGSEPRDDGSMPATEEHAWEVDRTIVRRARHDGRERDSPVIPRGFVARTCALQKQTYAAQNYPVHAVAVAPTRRTRSHAHAVTYARASCATKRRRRGRRQSPSRIRITKQNPGILLLEIRPTT
jgi:hypothetical protein